MDGVVDYGIKVTVFPFFFYFWGLRTQDLIRTSDFGLRLVKIYFDRIRLAITFKDKWDHNNQCVNLMDRMSIQRRWYLAAGTIPISMISADARSLLVHMIPDMIWSTELWMTMSVYDKPSHHVAPNPPHPPALLPSYHLDILRDMARRDLGEKEIIPSVC